MWRLTEQFSQRFTAEVSPDNQNIRGRQEANQRRKDLGRQKQLSRSS
jgi:hypothetical protein